MNKATYKNIRSKLNFKFNFKQFLKQTGGDLFLLASIIGLFQSSFSVINVFLIPVFMFRQFSVLHEAVHGLAHPNDFVNHIIGTIAGFFCLTPYAAWKAAHLKHHYWTGNLEQDPTFAILKQFNQYSSAKKSLIEFTWKKGIPLLGFLQHLGFWLFNFKNFSLFKNTFSSVAIIALYATLISQVNIINLAVLLIGISLYLRAFEEMIIPQHVGMYSNDEPENRSAAWEQQDITRSWYLGSLVEKHLTLNMNYHTEHHLFPDLPWYELKNAHQLLLQENEPVILVPQNWMSLQRTRLFEQVIIPVPSRKSNAA